MIPAGLRAALAKDFRLLVRDRVGLVFLTVAPIVVITVAGFSLASLYGADPRGESAYLLPLADEDQGTIGSAVRERLGEESAILLRPVGSRQQAQRLIETREAGAALVIPKGTSEAVEEGRPATLVVLSDPVKYLEVANVRGLVQELRHGLEAEARRRAEARLEKARAEGAAARAELQQTAQRLRKERTILATRLREMASELERRSAAVRSRTEEELRGVLRSKVAERQADMAARLGAELAPLRDFIVELRRSERAFGDWITQVREQAGKLADRMPPPPAPPAVPPELERLLAMTPEKLADRVLGAAASPLDLPAPPSIELPALPELPLLELPSLPELPQAALPGNLEIEETSVTGAPRRLNTFDQNVPGFSVTFLLLGMLFGVSLGLLDERDWGTLDRLRAMPTPFAYFLVAKLLSRLTVGMVQMVLLFAVGWAAFGVSLGPEPWALFLPTAGIVFAGTAFGLVVAGLANSREAVLPLGSIVIVSMAAIGGCWWPIDLEPRWMRSVALAFPTTWVMAAYNDLMIRRQPLSAALVPTAVLFAHGAVYLTIGLWLFRRRAV